MTRVGSQRHRKKMKRLGLLAYEANDVIPPNLVKIYLSVGEAW